MLKRFYEQGFTLLEVVVAMVILLIAIIGMGATILSSVRLHAANRELAMVMNQAKQILATVEAYNVRLGLEQTYQIYSSTSANSARFFYNVFIQDKDESGTLKQRKLQCDPDTTTTNIPITGVVGWIDFPEKPYGTLCETNAGYTTYASSGPKNWTADFADKDLNGDGDTTDTNVMPSDLQQLPVRITLRWKGQSGIREYKIKSVLPKVN